MGLWKSKEDLAAHFEQPYMKELLEVGGQVLLALPQAHDVHLRITVSHLFFHMFFYGKRRII